MFIRSTYFPQYCIRADRIKHVVLTLDPNDRTDCDAYTLHLHPTSGKVYMSKPIFEDPEHIMKTITAELNGGKTDV